MKTKRGATFYGEDNLEKLLQWADPLTLHQAKQKWRKLGKCSRNKRAIFKITLEKVME